MITILQTLKTILAVTLSFCLVSACAYPVRTKPQLDVAIYKCIKYEKIGEIDAGGFCYRKRTDHKCAPTEDCFNDLIAMPTEDFKKYVKSCDEGWHFNCNE